MPRRPSERPLTRLCVRLWSEDVEYLRDMSRAGGDAKFNLVLRTAVHSIVTHIRDLERRNLDERRVKPIEINLDEVEGLMEPGE